MLAMELVVVSVSRSGKGTEGGNEGRTEGGKEGGEGIWILQKHIPLSTRNTTNQFAAISR